MPPLRLSLFAPGASVTSEVKSRPFGSRSIISARTVCDAVLCLTSIIGDSEVTCTVSVSVDSCMVRSILST